MNKLIVVILLVALILGATVVAITSLPSASAAPMPNTDPVRSCQAPYPEDYARCNIAVPIA
jgi:hypothetical protein